MQEIFNVAKTKILKFQLKKLPMKKKKKLPMSQFKN